MLTCCCGCWRTIKGVCRGWRRFDCRDQAAGSFCSMRMGSVTCGQAIRMHMHIHCCASWIYGHLYHHYDSPALLLSRLNGFGCCCSD